MSSASYSLNYIKASSLIQLSNSQSTLIYSQILHSKMVNLSQVHSELATITRYGPGLVAVFVGGTSGIGESTAREFARYSEKPRIYIVGRSEEQGSKLVSEFKALNAGADTKFIKSDVSLIKNVDKVCEEIKKQEEKVNLLFLSAGMLTMDGRKGIKLDSNWLKSFY
jgi:FlaA1/EpsC-like NDP-sugar epimerase